MKKPLVDSNGAIIPDKNWRPVMRDREGALRFGEKHMPPYLRSAGFSVAVFETDEYIKINYGRGERRERNHHQLQG